MSDLALVARVAIAALVALSAAAADARAAGPARVVKSAGTTDRVVALTFDDGWHAGRCEAILEVLLAHGVPATWFPNAVYLPRAPALWRRIAEHHPIANHTAHHEALPRLSERGMRHEIAAQERRVQAVTGKPLRKLLRPPYGAHDRRVRRIAGELGYETLVLWDVDSGDASPRADDRSVARAASSGGPGSIVLMHCGPAVTPRVLPHVIAAYACSGYRFATVEDLLAGQAGEPARVTCPPPPIDDRRTGGMDLEGTEWRLAEAEAGAGLAPLPADATLTLSFTARRAGGLAGCGAFDVRVAVGRRGSLRFGRLLREPTSCPDDPGPDDPSIVAYLDQLVASARVRVRDGVLELLDAEGRSQLRFRVAEPAGLSGVWMVDSIAGAGGLLDTAASPTPLTVTFGPAGTLRGWGGCATFLGGYGVRGETVTAGPVLDGGTCADDRDVVEARLLAALRSVARWEIEGRVLRLRDVEDRVVLELVREGSGSSGTGSAR